MPRHPRRGPTRAAGQPGPPARLARGVLAQPRRGVWWSWPCLQSVGATLLHKYCRRLHMRWSVCAPGRIRTCGLLLRRQTRPVRRGAQPSTGCRHLDPEDAASLAVSGHRCPSQSAPVHRGLACEFWMTCDNVVTLSAPIPKTARPRPKPCQRDKVALFYLIRGRRRARGVDSSMNAIKTVPHTRPSGGNDHLRSAHHQT